MFSKRPDDFGFRYNSVLWSLLQHPVLDPAGRSAVGSRFVSFAAVFYGLLAVVAAVWCGLRGIELPVLGPNPLSGLALGLTTAAGTVSLSLLAYRLVPVTRKLAEELAPSLVDRTDRYGLVLVAIFSGVGEEVFFRGAVQQEFGLVISSLAFGLAHVGPDRRYLLWTAWAVLAGVIFGLLFEVTGGLLAPVTAHVVHNAATLLIWKNSRPVVPTDE